MIIESRRLKLKKEQALKKSKEWYKRRRGNE